jgi:hypothetical protein
VIARNAGLVHSELGRKVVAASAGARASRALPFFGRRSAALSPQVIRTFA